MTGTGLKKCIPTNRARRARADRLGQPVDRRSSDVFEAKIAPAGAMPRRARARARVLTAEVLEHRLDRRGRRRAAAARSAVGVDPLEDRVALVGRRAGPCDGALEVARDPLAAGLAPAPGRARTGRPSCRSPHGPGRCRGPSARRRPRRRARSSWPEGTRSVAGDRGRGESRRRDRAAGIAAAATTSATTRKCRRTRRAGGRAEDRRREPERRGRRTARRRPDDRAALRRPDRATARARSAGNRNAMPSRTRRCPTIRPGPGVGTAR